jgi:hypothetical protein
MDGSAHFRKAEELAAKAAEYLGQGDGQDSAAVWAAVAQVHATLALASATAAKDTPAAHDVHSPKHQESSPASQSRPIGSAELTDREYAAAERQERRDRAPGTDLPDRSGNELRQREELRRQP